MTQKKGLVSRKAESSYNYTSHSGVYLYTVLCVSEELYCINPGSLQIGCHRLPDVLGPFRLEVKGVVHQLEAKAEVLAEGERRLGHALLQSLDRKISI